MSGLRHRADELADWVRRARRGVQAAGGLAAVVAEQRLPPHGPPRVDPVPDLEALPRARYLVLVGAVPPRFGGRTASILNKCRLFAEIGGTGSSIITLNYTTRINELTADLRRRGLLADGVDIINMYEFLRGPAEPQPAVRHPVDQPGMDRIGDRNGLVFRYFENGVYRRYQRFDGQGRLLVRDWFNENRARTRRDDFRLDGTVTRTTYMDLRYNLPRQQLFFRADGSPYLNKWLTANPDAGTSTVERVTLLDRQGQPTEALQDDVELAHHFLGELVGEDRVFLTVESRQADRETLTFQRPNVKHLVVLHNPHLAGTGRNVGSVRASYQPMFERRDALDAVVFLTNTQRADAEARFGRHENFRVVPHPMSGVRQVPFEQRDPNLVVTLARLDRQKQLSEAIKAFALVVQAVPSARLEIYGRGEEQADLQRQIDELGVGRSVKLAGYTTDSAAVLERAALSLLTSRFEGYPLALLETLAHGCPVVSYDVKYGPREIIADGLNGYLVKAGDHETLAQRVIEVLQDPALRRQLSEHAGALSPEFSERTFVARWSKIFRDLDARGWDAQEPAADAAVVSALPDPPEPDHLDPDARGDDALQED